MTSPALDPASLDATDHLDEVMPAEVSLQTFVVLVRFRSEAADAVADVTARLTPVSDLHDRVFVERVEADGTTLVVVRFATVSVDGSSAVLGVHETLKDAGISYDEAWVQQS
jgi:hypothetical protein